MNTFQRLQRGPTGLVDQDKNAIVGLAWVVGVCAIVLTAWLLGATWLTRTFVGLPVGLWIAAGILGGRWFMGFQAGRAAVGFVEPQDALEVPHTGRAKQGLESSPQRETAAQLEQFVPPQHDGEPQRASVGQRSEAPVSAPQKGLIVPTRRVVAGVADGTLTIIKSCSGGTLPSWLERAREAGGTPGASLSRPLRIGIRIERPQFEALQQARHALEASFAPCPGSVDNAELRRLGFDALIEGFGGEGGVVIRVAEAPDAPAAWHDWSMALPLSYASLFPDRIDPAVVTIDALDWSQEGTVDLLRGLLETAALLGRYPSRLSVGDRLQGRPALGLMLGSPVVSDPALDRAMANVAEILSERNTDGVGALECAAMRVLGAYVAWSGCGLLPADRAQAARTIGRLGPAEGETCLRACVAAFAAEQEVLGFDLMLTGHERLAVERPEPLVDPMEYLISDIAFNRGRAETLGKLAAGLAYSTAFIDRPHLAYILDDVRDEVMSANWLTVNPDFRDRVLAMIEALSMARVQAAA